MISKRYTSLLIAFAFGLLLWFLPHSEELSDKGWHLFALFVATILAIILKPLPMGAISIIAMAVATGTKTLTLDEVLAGFHNEVAWLVLFAFFISLGFIKTGLGNRIGYYFIALFGKKTLGLSYGLLMSELCLAPAIPSVTARTGGVIFPIAQSLAKSFGSDPALGTERRIGAFLMKVLYQGSTITSAMFLTAMAANPMLAGLTQEAGYTFTWGMWALGAFVPGIITLLMMPIILYKLYPPAIRDTPDAPQFARRKLEEMGRLTKPEWLMLGVFVLLLVLWIFGAYFAMKSTTAALIGLAILLLFDVISWKDVIHEEKAWDTFIWFATLIMLAGTLNKYGFTPWLSEQVVQWVHNFHWSAAFLILYLVYYYSHYFFASNTAHVGAMYPAFLLMAIGLGTPPFLAIAALAYASNIMGGLTHYGSGPAPLFYGSGYIDVKSWWKLGFILSLFYIPIWLGLGSLWWKIIGLW